jgi:fibro-slime domain-containing protein
MHLKFTTQFNNDSQAVTVTGGDDIWVFLNGTLAIDLGGVHGPASGTFAANASSMIACGISYGQTVQVDIFQASRHTCGSGFTLTVNSANIAPVVASNPPPVITMTLLGMNPYTNFINDYTEAGATATDSVSGNLTSSIVISGNLQTNVPGNYTVTYSVTDAANVTATTNRTVVLLALPAMSAANIGGNQSALIWPTGPLTNYILQSTTNLTSGNWMRVTDSVPAICVTVSNSPPARFFPAATTMSI